MILTQKRRCISVFILKWMPVAFLHIQMHVCYMPMTSPNISYNTAAENSTLPIFIPYFDSTTSLPKPPEIIFAHPLWSWCLPFLIYSLTNLANPPQLISSTKIDHFTSMSGQVLRLSTTVQLQTWKSFQAHKYMEDPLDLNELTWRAIAATLLSLPKDHL